MYLGRVTIAEGVSKLNSHPFKVMQKRQACGFLYGYVYLSYEFYAIKVLGYVTCCYAEKHQLPSMTSKCSQMGKRLMIFWSFSSKENQRIKEITFLECNHSHG